MPEYRGESLADFSKRMAEWYNIIDEIKQAGCKNGVILANEIISSVKS
jgi:hypothetical protein